MAETTGMPRGPRGKTLPEEHGFSLDELKEWRTQLQTAVHNHPIISASVAVGVGVLIARLIKDAMDDEGDRKRRRRRKGGLLGSEIGRAVMGSLATMAAAKLQEALLSEIEPETAEDRPPTRKRPRKQARRSSAERRPGPGRPRRPKVEE